MCVADATFLDVKLLNTGNFVFAFQAATEMPAGLMADIEAFARSVQAQPATETAPTGAVRLSLVDVCWVNNGNTRSNFIADYDNTTTAYRERDAFLIGRRIQNIQVTALRNLVNADGSARTEIHIAWDVLFRDGTVARGEKNTLLRGSSAGTPRCTTLPTESQLRAIGNQQRVQVAVRDANIRNKRYALASGLPQSPAVTYRREVQFNITDPLGNATYAVMTEPGPTATVGNTVFPFSMKLLSPRLLRSAPELQGKVGNFLNWRDDDSFRNCRFANGSVPVAHVVNCAQDGGSSNVWGIGFTSTPAATQDQAFANQGWLAGGVYRFDLYNDDSWRTVNGQLGKTPTATYYAALDRLPHTFVQMANRYPLLYTDGISHAGLAANANTATPVPVPLRWARPKLPAAWPALQLFQVWQFQQFQQGPRFDNATGVFNPAYRTLSRAYPGTTATSTATFPVAPREPQQTSKTYVEYLLFYFEPGTFNTVQSRLSLQ